MIKKIYGTTPKGNAYLNKIKTQKTPAFNGKFILSCNNPERTPYLCGMLNKLWCCVKLKKGHIIQDLGNGEESKVIVKCKKKFDNNLHALFKEWNEELRDAGMNDIKLEFSKSLF